MSKPRVAIEYRLESRTEKSWILESTYLTLGVARGALTRLSHLYPALAWRIVRLLHVADVVEVRDPQESREVQP